MILKNSSRKHVQRFYREQINPISNDRVPHYRIQDVFEIASALASMSIGTLATPDFLRAHKSNAGFPLGIMKKDFVISFLELQVTGPVIRDCTCQELDTLLH